MPCSAKSRAALVEDSGAARRTARALSAISCASRTTWPSPPARPLTPATRGSRSTGEPDAPGVVDSWIALEVGRDRAPRDLLHHELRQGVPAHLEAAKIVREQKDPVGLEQASRRAQEPRVVALHVEGVDHGLGAREGGRIEEDEPVASGLALNELEAVGAYERVARAADAVEGEVLLRPVEVGVRQIHRRRRSGAALGRVDGGRPGVGEEVEETTAGGELADQVPGEALVEEEAGVEVVAQVDEEAMAALGDLEELLSIC